MTHAEQGMSMKMFVSNLTSPLGDMMLVTDASGRVRALEFAERRARLHRRLQEQYGAFELSDGPAPAAWVDALQRYFAGELRTLDRVETATAGTEQQERAWAALRRVPVGRTTTYQALGNAMGISDWRAAVEAGAAAAANPIAVVVPCHRVLGVDGDLKGYAWGLHRKRWLLEHEMAIEAGSAGPRTSSLF
jgi:methylated-DNA-[protein]-cysteine S-methyltransferase